MEAGASNPGFFYDEMRTVRITHKTLQIKAKNCVFALAFCSSPFIVLGNSSL
jgi:hypothetical protein